ncbi:MAG: ammonium transporter [Pseudomonadota bacterium]
MKRFLIALTLGSVLFGASPVFAENLAAAAPAASMAMEATPAETTAAVDAVAPATDAAPADAAASAEAAPPERNKGDTAWMLVCTAFVLMMTIPGVALFYGGMVRSKNMLSVLMQTFTIFCVIAVLWVLYGYSLAFTANSSSALNPFIGGLSKAFLSGVTVDSWVETFSKGVQIPELSFVMFQLTFAAITCALIIGGFAERMKFSAVLLFSVLWFTFAYLPMAHMVWFWGGPSAYADQSGFLFGKGAIDFAGGTVVHINAGIAGLVGALVVGKRLGYGKVSMAPHSLTMTLIGACLLWVGWFGFNAGSNLEANGYAALAFANTLFATAVAACAWTFAEWFHKGKPSLLGGVSGAIAGLVAITPACGFVGIGGALVVGLAGGLFCFLAVTMLKAKLGYDDSLDVFGVHAVGGIVGALLTGIFVNPALGGAGVVDYSTLTAGYAGTAAQLTSQLLAVGTAVVWSGVVAFVLFKIIDVVIGLRVSEEQEREGLDLAEHGERAYNQ